MRTSPMAQDIALSEKTSTVWRSGPYIELVRERTLQEVAFLTFWNLSKLLGCLQSSPLFSNLILQKPFVLTFLPWLMSALQCGYLTCGLHFYPVFFLCSLSIWPHRVFLTWIFGILPNTAICSSLHDKCICWEIILLWWQGNGCGVTAAYYLNCATLLFLSVLSPSLSSHCRLFGPWLPTYCVYFTKCLIGVSKCCWSLLWIFDMVESKERRRSYSELHHIILMSENQTERPFFHFSVKTTKKKLIFIHKRGCFFSWKEFFPSH